MSIEIIYHETETDDMSPFHETIIDIITDKHVKIACPYIKLDYLQQLLSNAESWQLITDVEEWLAISDTTAREKIRSFILSHRDRIRHCDNFHAKVIITDTQAILGSANLTKKGVGKNHEVSVCLDGEDSVQELNQWFDDLWSPDKIDIDELSTAIESTPQRTRKSNTSGAQLSSTAPPVQARIPTQEDENTLNSYQELVQRVAHAPSRDWIDSYFDLVTEALDVTGLDNSSPQLAMTLPSSATKLPVNINKRYVLTAYPKKGRIGYTLPRNAALPPELEEYKDDQIFGPLPGEDSEPPIWMSVPGHPDQYLTGTIKEAWKRAARAEVTRMQRSTHRDQHQSVVYQAATDAEYRETVLDEAFGQ